MSLKQELHDRLWRAFERWQGLRATGETKRELKLRGIREHGDPNHYTRNLIFAHETARSYEGVLKDFVEMGQREFGAQRLEELGKREFRTFMDRAIKRGLSAKTLQRMSSALVKVGCLTGHSASYIALGERYGGKIREMVAAGAIAGPARATPALALVERVIETLRVWDARHFDRTGEPRAYHLSARLQLETACRRISATERVTAASLRAGNRVMLIGKGGKEMVFSLSPELHHGLSRYVALYPGPLADAEGYRNAYSRAMEVAGGQVLGTHGARRAAAQEDYKKQYRAALASGLAPKEAADRAAGNAIERLGHSCNRRDHRRAYLGR